MGFDIFRSMPIIPRPGFAVVHVLWSFVIPFDIFAGSGIGDEGTNALSEALRSNTSLQKLHLWCVTPMEWCKPPLQEPPPAIRNPNV